MSITSGRSKLTVGVRTLPVEKKADCRSERYWHHPCLSRCLLARVRTVVVSFSRLFVDVGRVVDVGTLDRDPLRLRIV